MAYTFQPTESGFFRGDSFIELEFFHKDYSLYTEITCTNEAIYFKADEIMPIYYSSIEDVQENGKTLTLRGSFFQDNRVINSVKLTIFTHGVRPRLVKLINKTSESCTATLLITNGETSKEFDVEVKKTKDTIEVSERNSKKKFVILNQDDAIFLNQNILLFFNVKGYPCYLYFDPDGIPFNLSDFNVDRSKYFHSCCHLIGSLGEVRFKGNESISILLNEEDLYLIVNHHEVYSFSHSQLQLCLKQSNDHITFLFTAFSGDTSYIVAEGLPRKVRKSLPEADISFEDLAFIDSEPFQIDHHNDGWVFRQSPTIEFSIPAAGIKSLHIIDNDIQSSHILLEFEDARKLAIDCHPTLLTEFLRYTYKAKKLPLLQKSSVTNLYSSWSRQLNDFLNYNLFGQLIILQNGIKEIQNNKNIFQHMKNEQILNFMYYAIREQKRILERVAIQFPQSLMKEEQQFLHDVPTEGYERLQKQLLVIASQIQRQLSEIENSLNPLSFAIIPRKTFERNHDKEAKRNYWGAAALGGLGILTGGVGLLAVGGLMAVKSYYSNQEKKVKQQYAEENDQQKIDFYINKALDSFDHLIEVLLPFYISQVSKSFHQMTRKHGELLLQQDIDNAKPLMFNGLIELYTAKHLPLEAGSTTNRENIIEELMMLENHQQQLIGTLTK